MKTRGKTLAQEALFKCRIYFIFLAVAFHCLFINASYCQEIGAYRTIASGNFENIAIWQVFDGIVWSAATVKPSQVNDIYIDRYTLVTLTGNEEGKSVFINAQDAVAKLNLNNFNLNVHGSLQGFTGLAPGLPDGAHNSSDWIGNSVGSTITFKGVSRTIILDAAWSGNAQNSNYTVIFDPGSGIELSIEEPFKALKFVISSGSVIQNLTNAGTCATFSFNVNPSNGTGSFGDFIIEAGGTLISKCNSNIIFRSGTSSTPRSANLFDLQPGGTLILEGSDPKVEAATFNFKGNVIFRAGATRKSLPASTFADGGIISSFHDLEVQGIRNVQLPPNLNVNGSMKQTGTGQFLMSNTHLTFEGGEDQNISGFALSPQDLTVNKTGGEVKLEQNLNVLRNLTMLSGKLDFQNNSLTINSSNAGSLNYQGGSWENLTSFTYSNTPTNLNSTNGTFPFGDRYHGGIRKVELLGTNSGGNLTINYTEYKGADFNPGFNDSDATPILYRLFSYFNFSGLNSSSNSLELRISANNLIVVDPDDVRLVCTGYAAPGNHIPGTDPTELWAIRDMTFDDLPGKNFTVGSFRTLSILPVTWLSVSAKLNGKNKQINWSVAHENGNEKFEIYSSEDPLKDWTKVGEVASKGDSDSPTHYSFTDESSSKTISTYYQIKVTDISGEWAWSKVIRLETDQKRSKELLSIYPNPHTSGEIKVSLPDSFNPENTQVLIYSSQGFLISSLSFNEKELSGKLQLLRPGLYFITFSNSESSIQAKWIKR